MNANACPVGHTAFSCSLLVLYAGRGCRQVLCMWHSCSSYAAGGDRQEPPSGSIRSSTGRLPRRERPEGRGGWGAARGAGRAREGRAPPSHLLRKRKTVFRDLASTERPYPFLPN